MLRVGGDLLGGPRDGGPQLVGDLYDSGDGSAAHNDNHADYVNDRDDVTPTGLDLNDLPFIGMILLAVGAIAGYIVVKARKGMRVSAK